MADELIRSDENNYRVGAGITDDANEEVRNLRVEPATNELKVAASVISMTNGIGVPDHDYIGVAYAATTDTYTFKTGGSGGSTVATVVVTYTDSTKEFIDSVART